VYQYDFDILFTNRNPATEKITTSRASVVLLSIHLITVDELDIKNRTIKVIRRLFCIIPILTTRNMRVSNDNAGTTNIPGTPKNLTKGTESNGYRTLVEYSA
jgi:hypothetical protein